MHCNHLNPSKRVFKAGGGVTAVSMVVVLLAMAMASDARSQTEPVPDLPAGFSYLEDISPGIEIELRYSTEDNFLGRPVAGYQVSRGILTTLASRALANVQAELEPFGLGLKVFDAYRPQRAVNHFVTWAEDAADTLMKASYYPHVPKGRLFEEGYIAERSGHSRGSTVDLTLIDTRSRPPVELDMGMGYDFFGPESWPMHPVITSVQRSNRLLLRSIMLRHGFGPYEKEWWHFTLRSEPFPDTYFDFPVR